MEAKELRLANLLEYNNEPYKISSLNNDNTLRFLHKDGLSTIGCFSINRLNIKPIPLTEVWWNRFGYECIQDFLTDLIEESKIPLEENFNILVPYLESLSIHQIQNLWYE